MSALNGSYDLRKVRFESANPPFGEPTGAVVVSIEADTAYPRFEGFTEHVDLVHGFHVRSIDNFARTAPTSLPFVSLDLGGAIAGGQRVLAHPSGNARDRLRRHAETTSPSHPWPHFRPRGDSRWHHRSRNPSHSRHGGGGAREPHPDSRGLDARRPLHDPRGRLLRRARNRAPANRGLLRLFTACVRRTARVSHR